MRICKECKIEKSLDRFPSAGKKNGKEYKKFTCYNCTAKVSRIQKWKNRGIDADWIYFTEQLSLQENKCGICKRKIYPYQENRKKNDSGCLDHDHKTNKPRGILCETCNRGIGLLKDSVEIINQAAEYLKKWKPKK